MAKLVINNDKKMSTIAPEIYDTSRSIWEDVFMRDLCREDSDILNVIEQKPGCRWWGAGKKRPKICRWPGAELGRLMIARMDGIDRKHPERK